MLKHRCTAPRCLQRARRGRSVQYGQVGRASNILQAAQAWLEAYQNHEPGMPRAGQLQQALVLAQKHPAQPGAESQVELVGMGWNGRMANLDLVDLTAQAVVGKAGLPVTFPASPLDPVGQCTEVLALSGRLVLAAVSWQSTTLSASPGVPGSYLG